MTYRYANEKDLDLIIFFIKELAIYEKMLGDVKTSKENLKKWIFDEKKAEVIFPIMDNKEVGFALFFTNFSTFEGKPGIYLEDIYIVPEYRNKGIGTYIFKVLANIVIDRDYARFEWTCLNWNEPSIEFYLKLGAKPMNEWTVYRLSGENLLKVAHKK